MFKKLATLVCATAIAAGAFTGMVANAALERDKGINITAEKVADNQITLSVYAVGFDSIRNWGLNLAVTGGTLEAIDPEDFEPDDVANVGSLMFNVDNNVFISTGSSTKAVTLDDNLIFTATLSFTEDISSDITITLADGSTLRTGDKKSLAYYEESDPEDNTLGFNDCVISAGSPETPATVVAEVEDSKAFVDKDDENNCAVVGKIDLEVEGSIDLANATYNGNKADSITEDGQEIESRVITDANVILFVVINGTTDTAALSQVVFE